MNTLIRILLALLLIAPNASAEVAVEVYDLEEALHKASRNNAGLQSAEQDIKIAQQRVQEARFQFFPEIGFQANATRFNSNYPFALRPGFGSTILFPSTDDNFFSGEAYLQIPLYEGRRNINTLRLAQTSLKRARSKYEAVKLDLVYNTKRSFYQLLLTRKILEGVRGLSGQLRSFRKSNRIGPWQAVDAEALSSELRSQESQLKHRLDLARLQFLKDLNRELDTPIEVRGTLSTKPADIDLGKALVWATELRPELQAQTYRSQMDAIEVNLALGRRIPTVMLGLDYELNGSKFPLKQNNWDATVGVRIPFAFDFYTRYTQRIAEQRQGEIKRAELRDQVHLEVRKAYQEMTHWQQEYRKREREFLTLQKLTANARKKSGNSLNALKASRQVLLAQQRYLESITEHLLAVARLERAIGRSLPEGA